MKLLFDDDLVEEVVFLCASGRRAGIPALQIARFHREREKIYEILDPDERQAGFARVHLSWFSEWGLEQLLASAVRAFPVLFERLDLLGFRKARHPSEEGAELYVNASGARHGIVALRPARFEENSGLARWLNHELMHLNDMVHPAFAYSPVLQATGRMNLPQRLLRERYRVLWDVTIDARLIRSGRGTIETRENRRAELEKTFSFWPTSKQEAIFNSLWQDDSPSHNRLLALAGDPRDSQTRSEPVPGAPCPLCGFPTFDWADTTALDAELVARVSAEFPDWTPEMAMCQRCLETYRAGRRTKQKAESRK